MSSVFNAPTTSFEPHGIGPFKNVLFFLWLCIDPTVTVRLVQGGQESLGMGMVEAYHNGEWGAVCGKTFSILEADVVCGQLGFRKALEVGLCTEEGREGVRTTRQTRRVTKENPDNAPV